MGAISPLHLLIVAVVALIVIGPGKLPETGAALGRALREFRDAQRDDLPPTPGPTAAVPPVADAVAAESPIAAAPAIKTDGGGTTDSPA